ncbi:MAG TPA: prolyl oligopeptidase family serine peptidase [Vicinamibacterales bacterium]|nr:prolyl oligopeptidase family serine peptidase [Vicinamibacterales bacterium]
MSRRLLAAAVVAAFLLPALPVAQAPHPPTRAEWGQFEQLATFGRGGLSPDGRWVAYGINRSNRENELRIREIATGTEKTVPFGAGAVFSADSRWVAYSIGYSEAQEERMRAQRRPIHRKLGLLKLDGASEPAVIDGIEAFALDPAGGHIVMRRYAPERTPAAGGAPAQPAAAPTASGDDPTPQGVTIIVRHLDSGRDVTFGNVSEYAWQSVTEPSKLRGRLLAFVISAEDKAGNGVNLYDAATGVHRVLDSGPFVYSGLSWRRDADDLAALRAHTDERRDGATHVALAWPRVGGDTVHVHTMDPRQENAIPAGMRTVSFRRPSWSDDGATVFLGVADWREKAQERKPDPPAGSAAEGENSRPPAEELPTVDVWHARDVDVMPRQKLRAAQDRQRNLLAAWHLGTSTLVPLARSHRETVVPLRRQKLAYSSTWDAYAMDRTIGRPAADISLVDLRTGARTPVAERINDGYLEASPGGRYLLYLHNDHYWTVDTATRAVTSITRAVPTSFVDRESDVTVRQKPPFGVAGWTPGDTSVLLYDKFDVWQVAADGSKATRLTDGAAEQVRHRYVRLNPDDEWIDTDKPVILSLFGTWTKRSGYARWNPAAKAVERLLYEDKAIAGLAKARDAGVFLYTSQRFDDSPDAFVAGADLRNATQVTATNPFMAKFAWGRSEVIEFKSDRGQRLQGTLYYPAGYEPGRAYPMVVYLYEKLSDGVHRFVPPSERDYYNTSALTSQGYVVFQPDIVFRPREPGVSVVECVVPAVKRVVAMGVADPKRVGVVGHSWGGFDASYLATHTTGVFAAAVAGAAITNLVSNYGNHHWSSGIAETDHIETGQQRMEVPLYEDLPAYIRNSAVFNVHSMKTPLLLMFGDNDGTVHWHQGVELYNIARRAKKDVVLLAYGGEDHGLRRKANQIDYQKRIHEWFAHYLKNEPAPRWITEGVPFIEREQELKRTATKKGT